MAFGSTLGAKRRSRFPAFHEEISSGMLGAVFKIHQAQEKLNSVDSPEAETVSEASELLSDAIDKMSAVMDDEKKESEAADRDSA